MLNTTRIEIAATSGMKNFVVKPLFGMFAKAPYMNINQYNDKMVVHLLHPGQQLNSTQAHPPSNYALRSKESIKKLQKKAEKTFTILDGIKGKTVLFRIIDIVTGVLVDYTHCVLEGYQKILKYVGVLFI